MLSRICILHINNAQNDIGITIMCLYVTLRYCVERAKPIVKKFYRLVFLQLNPHNRRHPRTRDPSAIVGALVNYGS